MIRKIIKIILLGVMIISFIKVKANNEDSFVMGSAGNHEYYIRYKLNKQYKYVDISRPLRMSDNKTGYSINPTSLPYAGIKSIPINEGIGEYSKFTEQLLQKIQVSAYLGEQLMKENIKWFYIAQYIIFEMINPNIELTFYDYQNNGISGYFDKDVKTFKELLELNLKLPEFYLNEISTGETIVVEDKNKILNTFNVVSSDNIAVTMNDNTLKITGLKEGNSTIKFIKKDSSSNGLLLYKYDSNKADILVVNYQYPFTKNIDFSVIKNKTEISLEPKLETKRVTYDLPNTFEEINLN